MVVALALALRTGAGKKSEINHIVHHNSIDGQAIFVTAKTAGSGAEERLGVQRAGIHDIIISDANAKKVVEFIND